MTAATELRFVRAQFDTCRATFPAHMARDQAQRLARLQRRITELEAIVNAAPDFNLGLTPLPCEVDDGSLC